MRFIFFILLFFITYSYASKNDILNIALYGLDKKIANEKTVEKLLLKLYDKIDNLKDKKINTFFYKTEKELVDDIKSDKKKFDFLYTIPSVYLRNYNIINNNTINHFAITTNESKYVQYYLVASKDLSLKKLLSLKNKKLRLQSMDFLGQYWFENLFLSEGVNYYKKNIKINKNKVHRQYKKILDVYFGKIDLAIISKNSWETTIDLNPKIKNKIHVLKKSEEIFPAVITVSNRNINKDILKHHHDFILDENNEEYISNILSLVKFSNVIKIDKNDYDKAHKFYEKYLFTKQKYK